MGFRRRLRELVLRDIGKLMDHNHFNNDYLWLCLLADFFLINFIIGPCNVLLWRGSWELYIRLFTPYPGCGPWLVLAGLTLGLPVIIFSKEVSRVATAGACSPPQLRTPRYLAVTRLYSLLSFLVMLLLWQGWFDTWYPAEEGGWGPPPASHWQMSLSCLLGGSLVLSRIGCLRTAALSTPMGLWLDTATQYLPDADQFYPPMEEAGQSCWKVAGFRLLNATLTLAIEVLSLVTYYGAYTGIEDVYFLLYHNDPEEQDQNIQITLHLVVLSLAVLATTVSYGASILYVYMHYEVEPNKTLVRSTTLDLSFYLILLLATVATALHFYAWWGLLTSLKVATFGDYEMTQEEDKVWRDVLPEFIFAISGFTVQVLLGVGSGNHFGVTWESRREEWGMLLPFLYLTYILRTCEHEEDPNSCRVVDILSDILYGVEDEEEMEEGEREEKREETEEQKKRNDQEGG